MPNLIARPRRHCTIEWCRILGAAIRIVNPRSSIHCPYCFAEHPPDNALNCCAPTHPGSIWIRTVLPEIVIGATCARRRIDAMNRLDMDVALIVASVRIALLIDRKWLAMKHSCRRVFTKEDLLPLARRKVRAMSLKHHLALAAARVGEASETQWASLPNTVHLAYFMMGMRRARLGSGTGRRRISGHVIGPEPA